MKKLIDLKIIKTIGLLALPAIIEMALNTLLGIADTIMISKLINKDALVASGYANSVFFALIFIFTSFNTGAIAMISRYYGEENFKKLKKVASETATLNFLMGVFITIIAILFTKEIFSMYDLTPIVKEKLYSYFKIVSYSLIPMFLSFSFSAVLRGSGDTKTPMKITAIANILNIIGNYILIMGIGIFPKMGIEGAALSTTISRFLAFFMYAYILFNKKNKIHIDFKNLMLTSDVLKPLLNLSIPGAIEQLSMQTAFVIGGIITAKLSTTSEAVFRILINIESISFMPAVGISIAAATLVGKSLGEKNKEKAKEVAKASSILAVCWGIFVGSLFLVFPKQIVSIFTNDINIIKITPLPMLVAGLNQPFLNYMITMSGAIRGAGDTKAIMVITSLRLWTMFVPLTYVFIVFLKTDIEGLWYAEILSFFVFSVILTKRYLNEKWLNIKIN